jgi:hypothetical protein
MIEPIDIQLMKDIENLAKDIGYQFGFYGDNPIAIIIGETHSETGEKLEFQNTIVRMIKPECVISERYAEAVKSQIMQKDKSLAERARFVGFIGSSEDIQGNIIEKCSKVCTEPLIVLIGHWHARKRSNIHKILKGKIGYGCVWSEEECEKVQKEQNAYPEVKDIALKFNML